MTEALASTRALPRLSLGAVITVGTFDGVHLGHRAILSRVARRAADRSLPSVLVTFEPHPLDVVNPSAAPLLLSTTNEKLELVAECGIDYAVIVPFTPSLAALDPSAFVEKLLLDRYCLRELLIGHDHGFGRGRSGDIHILRQLGERFDFEVEMVEAVAVDGAPVSSSAIRRSIASGDLESALRSLGRRYSFSGHVVPGDQRGAKLGFPTVNIALQTARKLLPPVGVYAVLLESERGTFGGMMNLGPRPTFDDPVLSLEVHLFDATGDWYGAPVRVEFVSRLRDTVRFDSVDALVAQLRADEHAARAALTQIKA
ncbi:MAG TPA: bifunctional riboflavin kinase/FAD synthetase [Gemmatimonadaceae bacterium]|nr:bifunctional riboflavin kinase/FAD synthetase [Gemmatimonadaceae bacterium]